MKPKIDHVILTRFNLPTAGVESLIRAKEGWLRDRQELFEQHCLPSVRLQTNQNFSWIIYFDTQSPQWLKERISVLSATGIFIPIYRDAVSPEELLSDVETVRGSDASILLTTNLDNDDGLSINFVERLQESVVDEVRTAIYIPAGLIQQGEKLYLRHDKDNAFCSVSELWSDAKTCWVDWHNLLHQHMRVKEVNGEPGWLQVVHTGNVSNRVRGRRVSAENYRSSFAGRLPEIVEPRKLDLINENLIQYPIRTIREWARGSAKKVALQVGGKDTLENMKNSGLARVLLRK